MVDVEDVVKLLTLVQLLLDLLSLHNLRGDALLEQHGLTEEHADFGQIVPLGFSFVE